MIFERVCLLKCAFFLFHPRMIFASYPFHHGTTGHGLWSGMSAPSTWIFYSETASTIIILTSFENGYKIMRKIDTKCVRCLAIQDYRECKCKSASMLINAFSGHSATMSFYNMTCNCQSQTTATATQANKIGF